MSARLVGSAAVLLVQDVVAAAHHYRDRLGFSYERFWGEPPCFCILERDRCHLMLSQVENAAEIVPRHRVVEDSWDLYFWVDDADALHRELVERGASLRYGPVDQEEYGCRELCVEDADGYRIAFGQDLDPCSE